MPHLQIHEMQIREKHFMHKHLVMDLVILRKELSVSEFHESQLGEARNITRRTLKLRYDLSH